MVTQDADRLFLILDAGLLTKKIFNLCYDQEVQPLCAKNVPFRNLQLSKVLQGLSHLSLGEPRQVCFCRLWESLKMILISDCINRTWGNIRYSPMGQTAASRRGVHVDHCICHRQSMLRSFR